MEVWPFLLCTSQKWRMALYIDGNELYVISYVKIKIKSKKKTYWNACHQNIGTMYNLCDIIYISKLLIVMIVCCCCCSASEPSSLSLALRRVCGKVKRSRNIEGHAEVWLPICLQGLSEIPLQHIATISFNENQPIVSICSGLQQRLVVIQWRCIF